MQDSFSHRPQECSHRPQQWWTRNLNHPRSRQWKEPWVQVTINIFVDDSEPNASVITQSLPLGYNVVDKTKQQIWDDKYIELGQLVNQHSPTETILFQGPDATFKISTGHKPSKQLATIHQWTNCFDIFMSIYLLKFTDRVQQILKYANMIRSQAPKWGSKQLVITTSSKAAHGLEWSVIHDELGRSATSLQYRAAPTKSRDKVPFRRDSQQEFL